MEKALEVLSPTRETVASSDEVEEALERIAPEADRVVVQSEEGSPVRKHTAEIQQQQKKGQVKRNAREKGKQKKFKAQCWRVEKDRVKSKKKAEESRKAEEAKRFRANDPASKRQHMIRSVASMARCSEPIAQWACELCEFDARAAIAKVEEITACTPETVQSMVDAITGHEVPLHVAQVALESMENDLRLAVEVLEELVEVGLTETELLDELRERGSFTEPTVSSVAQTMAGDDEDVIIVKAPTVSKPMVKIDLWVRELDNLVGFSHDSGAAATLISAEYARNLGLSVLPIQKAGLDESPFVQADGKSRMELTGAVQWTIMIPGRNKGIRVWALVVDQLFCPALLGRNVIELMDIEYGGAAAWTSGGDQMAPAILASLEEAVNEEAVRAESSWRVPTTYKDLSSIESLLRAAFWVEEDKLLQGDNDRVSQIQGIFTPSKTTMRSNVTAAHSVSTGTVDWKTPARDGKRKVTVPVQVVMGKSKGKSLIAIVRNQVLGTFTMAKMAVAPIQLAKGGDTEPTQVELANELVRKPFKESPFLGTMEAKES
jgi:hypothetical protein